MSYEMMREQARIALTHGWEDFRATVLSKLDLTTTSRDELLKLAFEAGAGALLQMVVVESINPMRYEIEERRKAAMPKPPPPEPRVMNPDGPTHWPPLPGHPEIKPPPILRR